MALSLGPVAGIFAANLGSYDKGEFDHSLEFQEIIPSRNDKEKADILAELPVELPIELRLKMAGYSPAIIEELVPPPA